jgi:ADP-ribose pyrophosphatase YjhB (NUDIX family)
MPYLPKEEFYAIFSKVPRLCVEVVIRDPSGKGILLTKRSIYPRIGEWHFPGGTVLFGETFEEAVKRVALDELGVDVRVGKMLGQITYAQMHKDGYEGWAISIPFEAAIVGGELRGSEQGEEFKFWEEVPKPTIADTIPFLRKQLAAQPEATAAL